MCLDTHTLTHTLSDTCILHSAHASLRHTQRDREVFLMTESSFEMLHEVFSEGVSTYFYAGIREKTTGNREQEITKTENPSR